VRYEATRSGKKGRMEKKGPIVKGDFDNKTGSYSTTGEKAFTFLGQLEQSPVDGSGFPIKGGKGTEGPTLARSAGITLSLPARASMRKDRFRCRSWAAISVVWKEGRGCKGTFFCSKRRTIVREGKRETKSLDSEKDILQNQRGVRWARNYATPWLRHTHDTVVRRIKPGGEKDPGAKGKPGRTE